jgi:hypothetical protein
MQIKLCIVEFLSTFDCNPWNSKYYMVNHKNTDHGNIIHCYATYEEYVVYMVMFLLFSTFVAIIS